MFLRKCFRFNYQLLWSPQDQPAFTAFPTYFTPDECLPFIITEQNEHPYFFRPDSLVQHNIDRINFDPHLITDNNLLDDNRPYHYQRNTPVQRDLLINFDNNDTDNEINNENLLQQQEVIKENIPQQQYENEYYNENNQINENNTREDNTEESTSSAQNASQAGSSTNAGTSKNTRSFRIRTRSVSPRQNTLDPQPNVDILQNRNITFNFPPHPDENTQNETQSIIQEDTQHIISVCNTSVNVSSPTRTTFNNPRYMTRPRYDPPSISSAFQSNRSIQLNENHNDYQPTSSRYYDPFNYSFFPSSDTSTNTNKNPNSSQQNFNSRTQNPLTNTQPINSSRNEFNSQSQATSYTTSHLHTTQPFQGDIKTLHSHIYLLILYIK